ncbi:MAG TPA: penicillin-binding protein 1C [Gemmatimonadales bacterium]|nr:penicillin-binding protein 1C [Gemmatimonadales bacterium]
MKLRRAVLATLGLALLGAIPLALWVALPLPPELLRQPRTPTLRLLDRAGAPLRTTRTADGTLQQWVPLSELDPALLVAFIAAEDRRFLTHHGVDPLAASRALLADLKARRVVSGASTIPMQLARLLLPLPRSLPGKLVQGLWALRLDAQLSKQTILEQYLNRVPLGQGSVGVEEAAALYFGASARALSAGQAALLAGLAGAPSRDNPLVSPRRAAQRRALVLARMRKANAVTTDEATAALLEPVLPAPLRQDFLAPHYTAALLSRLAKQARAPNGDLRTPLDLPLQALLEAEVRHTVETLRSSGVRHAAAVVLDNRSGGILAWVGSPDFFEPRSGQVDMVSSPRQPGSALKPFLYGLAFDRGYTAASVLPDVATVYQTSTGPYAPRNYDRRFHGPVRAREALGSSFNVPAVELANRLGPAELLLTLRRAGFHSLDRDAVHYGLGLALGNGDVSLLELANGYRAIAAGGVWHPVRWLEDERMQEPGQRVMSAPAAALVLDILADPVARIPGFGPITPLEFPFPAAAKTGTSRHFTDNWAVAVTAGFTVAVWVGNFDGRPMEGVSGITGAAPLLHRATLLTAARHPPGVLPTLEQVGAVPVAICRLSGLRAGAQCPLATEWFLPGTLPPHLCDWHDARGGISLPPQFADWASTTHLAAVTGTHAAARPAEAAASSHFHITSPLSGDVFRFVPGVDPRYATIGLRAAGGPRAGRIRWSVDGAPLRGTRLPLVPGRHVIRAAAGSLADSVMIEVKGK